MNKLFRKSNPTISEEDMLKMKEAVESQKEDRASNKKFLWGSLGLSIVLLCVFVYLLLDTLATGAKAASSSFDAAKSEAASQVYQDFYDKSYEVAEKTHHTSNRASLTVGTLREEQKLEVLKVSEVEYETPQPKDQEWLKKFIDHLKGGFVGEVESWLEVPGHGIFTVNLKTAEFIIDEAHQYILIRVPRPDLTVFTIDYADVELLLFEKGGVFRNSSKYGIDKAREQLQNAELRMREKIRNNQDFYQRAMNSATTMLSNLVSQLNPEYPELIVEVEFLD